MVPIRCVQLHGSVHHRNYSAQSEADLRFRRDVVRRDRHVDGNCDLHVPRLANRIRRDVRHERGEPLRAICRARTVDVAQVARTCSES